MAAAVLHPNNVTVLRATDMAFALKPLLGDSAMIIFMAGLWAATLSTISPTFMAGAYFLSDKRFTRVIIVGCLLSMAGPFIKGSFFCSCR